MRKLLFLVGALAILLTTVYSASAAILYNTTFPVNTTTIAATYPGWTESEDTDGNTSVVNNRLRMFVGTAGDSRAYYNITNFHEGVKISFKAYFDGVSLDTNGCGLYKNPVSAISAAAVRNGFGNVYAGIGAANTMETGFASSIPLIVGLTPGGEYNVTFKNQSYSGDFVNVTVSRNNVVNSSQYAVNGTDPNSVMYFNCLANGGSTDITFEIDDLCIYNESTSYSDCFPQPVADTLNITATAPANGTSFDTSSISINATVSSTSSFNITLFVNGVANQTFINVNSGSSVLVSANFTFSSTFEGNLTYYFSAINTNATQENSTQAMFWIDRVDPVITWITPGNTNTTAAAYNLSTNITLTDSNLYSYQYNISYLNGSVIYNESSISLTGRTSFNLNASIQTLTYGQTLLATVRVCDGHTAKSIREFKDTHFTSNELRFDTQGSPIKVYLEDKTKTKNGSTIRKADRYSFRIETKVASSSESFIVETIEPITILDGKTNYKGHLVVGEKWIDFEGSNVGSVAVERIASNKVRITVGAKNPTTDWSFESVGELNCVQESKQFLAVNYSQNVINPVLAGSSNTYSLNITYNGTFISSAISATFYYNGTGTAVTGTNNSNYYSFSRIQNAPTVSADANITYYWTYTIGGINYNTSSVQQQVYSFVIDNCSTYTTQFVNFTVRDEGNSSTVVSSYEININYSSSNYSKLFTGAGSNTTNFAFCIYPQQANLTGNIFLSYAATNYDTREWIQYTYTIDNTTDLINLYLLSTTTTSEIVVHVVDSLNQDLENILIEAYRYDPGTDNDTLVESELSDSGGNVVFNLEEGTAQYSFKFYQSGSLVLSTNRFKVYSALDPYEYTIGEQEVSHLGERLQIISGLIYDLTYTNSSKLVNFSWSYGGSEISQFCMNISTTNQSFYSSCSSSSASSLTYTITTLNLSYTAISYFVSDTGRLHFLESLGIDTRSGWRILGPNTSIFILICLILIFAGFGIGTGDKAIALICSFCAFAIVYFMGLGPISRVMLSGVAALFLVRLVLVHRRGGGFQ